MLLTTPYFFPQPFFWYFIYPPIVIFYFLFVAFHFAAKKFWGIKNAYSGFLDLIKNAFSVIAVSLITLVLLSIGMVVMLYALVLFFQLCSIVIDGIVSFFN